MKDFFILYWTQHCNSTFIHQHKSIASGFGFNFDGDWTLVQNFQHWGMGCLDPYIYICMYKTRLREKFVFSKKTKWAKFFGPTWPYFTIYQAESVWTRPIPQRSKCLKESLGKQNKIGPILAQSCGERASNESPLYHQIFLKCLLNLVRSSLIDFLHIQAIENSNV